jgi:fatty acid desaturase
MRSEDRPKLIFHGAMVLLVGLLCGLPTTIEASNESERFWHTAHEALIMMGIWMLVMSSVRSALVLPRREAAMLVWFLLATGYGFMVALVMGGLLGTSPFKPGGTVPTFTAFVAAVVGIFGAVMATLVTLRGAHAAGRGEPVE